MIIDMYSRTIANGIVKGVIKSHIRKPLKCFGVLCNRSLRSVSKGEYGAAGEESVRESCGGYKSGIYSNNFLRQFAGQMNLCAIYMIH
jgi:hypothetical protein